MNSIELSMKIIRDYREIIQEKDKEIERLNNIIDTLYERIDIYEKRNLKETKNMMDKFN